MDFPGKKSNSISEYTVQMCRGFHNPVIDITGLLLQQTRLHGAIGNSFGILTSEAEITL